MSSIRSIVIAASVANFRHLILLMHGSRTPAFLLSRTLPSIRSKPILEKQKNTTVNRKPLENESLVT